MAKGASKIAGGAGGGKTKPKDVELITNAKSFGNDNMTQVAQAVSDFFDTPKWLGSLSPGQKSGVTWYTGSAYSSLNSALRSGKDADDLSYLSPNQKAKVKQIDQALAKGELKEPITLYRGSTADLLGGASTVPEIQKLIGATIRDKAYVSSSISKQGSFGGSVAYKIIVPAGKGRGAYVKNISNIGSEYEYLLKRNTSFRVMGVAQKKSGKPVVTLQVVDE